jgi:hypothetical protein
MRATTPCLKPMTLTVRSLLLYVWGRKENPDQKFFWGVRAIMRDWLSVVQTGGESESQERATLGVSVPEQPSPYRRPMGFQRARVSGLTGSGIRSCLASVLLAKKALVYRFRWREGQRSRKGRRTCSEKVMRLKTAFST